MDTTSNADSRHYKDTLMINLISKMKKVLFMDLMLLLLKEYSSSFIKKYTNLVVDRFQQPECRTINLKKCIIELYSIALIKDLIILDRII